MLRNGKKFRQHITSSESSSQLPTDDRNPLLNHVVLTNLFEFCELTDLLSHRLVSKQWYDVSLPRVRKEATVKINNKYASGECSRCHLQWTTLHQDFQVEEQPFRCFKLGDVEFLTPPVQSKLPNSWYSQDYQTYLKGLIDVKQMYTNMEQFWRSHGQFIRRLQLQGEVYSVEAFKNAIFEDTPNLEELALYSLVIGQGHDPADKDVDEDVVNLQPNLQSLSVTCGNYTNHGYFPIKWSCLFAHFPNIRRLKLHAGYEFEDAFAALLSKLESSERISLNSLTLKFTILTEDQVTALKKLLQHTRLKLEFLEMWIGYCNEDVERTCLQEVLGLQGSTLKSLIISASPFNDDHGHQQGLHNNFPFRSEALQNLTHLELDGDFCPNFHFLQQTPNLEILRLRGCPQTELLSNADMKIMRGTKLPFLREFSFHSHWISAKEMRRFVRLMPSVERFYAYIDAGAFRVICKHWRNLRVLVIDPAYYGVRDRNRKDWDALIGDDALTGIIDGSEERLPNITDLKCLETLKITNKKRRIRDASVWNGFLQLPRLSTLEVSPPFGRLQFRKETFDALRARFPQGKFGPGPLIESADRTWLVENVLEVYPTPLF